MRRSFLGVFASLTVPLFLFLNVWQSQRYMVDYFEVRGLIQQQESLVQSNKRLINRVAELESPTRIASIIESEDVLRKIGGDEIVRLQMVDVRE